MAGGLITYEENGFPIELETEAEIARAVQKGRLNRDTIVRDHSRAGTVVTGRAEEIARLRPFFGLEDAPIAAPPPADGQSEPAGKMAAAKSRARAQQTATVSPWMPSPPVAARAPDVQPEAVSAPAPEALADEQAGDASWAAPAPETPSGSGNGPLIWLAVAVAAVVLLIVAMSGGSSSTDSEAANAATTLAPTEQPTDIIGTEASYWANREVRVRKLPGAESPALGSLKRGDIVRAVQVRGPDGAGDWVRIEAGEFVGGYVWAKNLSGAARPALSSTIEKQRALAQGASVYAEPSTDAEQIRPLAGGSNIRILGMTEDGWLEIALETGGVGYLEPGMAFAGCQGAGCRVVTADGWAGIVAGMRVEEAEAASGLKLRFPGHYDDAFSDEPGRLQTCNIHGLVGAPDNVSVFVQEGIVTSMSTWLDENDRGEGFETDRGIGLGDTEEAVRRAYPSLEEEPDIYSEPPDKKLFFRRSDGKGIKFSIVGGKVRGITAGGSSINYVEGCL
jgi:hypothetical protein